MKVIELFAGVGGFRIGLERASSKYEVVWANQWEPGTKTQHAHMIYEKKFWKRKLF
jgi:DNA (cytosine-5)-methyltransferase 1